MRCCTHPQADDIQPGFPGVSMHAVCYRLEGSLLHGGDVAALLGQRAPVVRISHVEVLIGLLDVSTGTVEQR